MTNFLAGEEKAELKEMSLKADMKMVFLTEKEFF